MNLTFVVLAVMATIVIMAPLAESVPVDLAGTELVDEVGKLRPRPCRKGRLWKRCPNEENEDSHWLCCLFANICWGPCNQCIEMCY